MTSGFGLYIKACNDTCKELLQMRDKSMKIIKESDSSKIHIVIQHTHETGTLFSLSIQRVHRLCEDSH